MPALPQTVRTAPRGVLLDAGNAAVAAGGCRRHSEGQTGLLVELATDGPMAHLELLSVDADGDGRGLPVRARR